mgnify:CR=1 FL=1
MEWYQVLSIILGNAAVFLPMFFWLRTESRADMRMMLTIIDGIQKEMKDFHGRLCAIEERNKK